jgi:hypothetical protein
VGPVGPVGPRGPRVSEIIYGKKKKEKFLVFERAYRKVAKTLAPLDPLAPTKNLIIYPFE